jgi:anti-sigma factor (TIGR02949 family)
MIRLDRIACEETFRRLDDYIDRSLTEADRRLVEEHLERCEMCAREFRFEQTVVSDVRTKLNRIKAPKDLMSRIADTLATAEPAEDESEDPAEGAGDSA